MTHWHCRILLCSGVNYAIRLCSRTLSLPGPGTQPIVRINALLRAANAKKPRASIGRIVHAGFGRDRCGNKLTSFRLLLLRQTRALHVLRAAKLQPLPLGISSTPHFPLLYARFFSFITRVTCINGPAIVIVFHPTLVRLVICLVRRTLAPKARTPGSLRPNRICLEALLHSHRTLLCLS